jgi:hypothetical protein
MNKKICSICLENVHRSAHFNLNCECRYNVHYGCFNKWWINNKNCIICHEICDKPTRFNKTPKRQARIKRRVPIRTYPTDTRYIHEYIKIIPFDNENELKTIIIIIITGCLFYILFQLL